MDNPEISRLSRNATERESKGDVKGAVSELEKAVALRPEDGNVYNHLGDLYIRADRKADAIRVYKTGVDVFRRTNYPRNSLALCRKILKYEPDNDEVYVTMGKLLVSLDAKSDALTYLFEYVERQKEKQDINEVIETLDYMRSLGVTDKRQVERIMAAYNSVGMTDRAKLLAEASVDAHADGEMRIIFDRKIKVLIVEDDEDDYMITRDLLGEVKEIGFDLEWARTFSAGLEMITGEQFDVCLMDYHLGAHTGLELLGKAIEKGCTVPVILFTGRGGRAVDLEAMHAGAVDYLVKGTVDASGLEKAIRYAIERNRLLIALRDNQKKLREQLIQSVALMDSLKENQEKLRDQAIRDDLTGLFNRQHFMETLAGALAAARKEATPLCLCIGDIDHFKEINDLYGHQAGDEVILGFTRIINDIVGAPNAVGRWGGDEFCILFPRLTVEEVIPTVEVIRSKLDLAGFKSERGEVFKSQASFGIAEFSGSGTQQELFRVADQALYAAKAAGRNRIVARKLSGTQRPGYS